MINIRTILRHELDCYILSMYRANIEQNIIIRNTAIISNFINSIKTEDV
jgi:hypothetical protein